MFCEIPGSTSLSTQIDPEGLRDLIDAYHKVVAETVESFDGFVAQYLGDGVLIYFGYPKAHEDDPESAVRAGLAVIHATAELSGSVTLQVRIGIATGIVVVRDPIGVADSQDLGVLGATPKLAARVATLAEPDTIVIAEGTRRQVVGLFDLEDLGPQELKGFGQPQHGWQVLGESDVASQFEDLPSGETPLRDRHRRRRRRRHRHGHRHRKSLSLFQNLLILAALIPLPWLIFSKIETPTQNDATTKTAANASAPAQNSTQRDTQALQSDEDSSLSTRVLETRLGQVFARDQKAKNADANDLAPRLPLSKQVTVDDKLTAEEVFASRNKGEVQLPGPMFNVGGESCKDCLTAQALSESERLRYLGLVVIDRMAALTLYNKRCIDIAHLTDDKAEALDIIENQFNKLPRDVQEKALDRQTKSVVSRSPIYQYNGRLIAPGGFQWFCGKMTNAIKDGEADPMFKAAREGLFPIEGTPDGAR